MAKVSIGQVDSRCDAEILDELRRTRGQVRYVFGLPLMLEIEAIRRPKQRRDLARVIEEFTSFSVLLPPEVVAELEVDAAVCQVLGREQSYGRVPLVGSGVLRAAGVRGGVRVRRQDGSDVTDAFVAGLDVIERQVFEREVAAAELTLNRAVLSGPQDDNERLRLRAEGWAPEKFRDVADARARSHQALAAKLAADPRWRAGRLRDLLTARYLAEEIPGEALDRFAIHGVTPTAILKDIDAARRFADAMPCADVWITLAVANHRNRDSKWTRNDVFDLLAMSVAVAYCDIVVTEKHSTHVLKSSGTAARLKTNVIVTLKELAALLDKPPQPKRYATV